MSLLKKQSSFEEKLKAQLDGTEMKPSDALWNRIEQNMYADSFEPKLQEKLENYSVDPRQEVWEQVESNLPEAKRKRGFFWVGSVSALLLLTFLAGFWFSKIDNKQLALQDANNPANVSGNATNIAENSASNEDNHTENSVSNESSNAQNSASNEDNHTENSVSNASSNAQNKGNNAASIAELNNAVVNRNNLSEADAASQSMLANQADAANFEASNVVTQTENKATQKAATKARKNTASNAANNTASNAVVGVATNKAANKSTRQATNPNHSSAASPNHSSAANTIPPVLSEPNTSANSAAPKQASLPPANADQGQNTTKTGNEGNAKPNSIPSEPKVILESINVSANPKDTFAEDKIFRGSAYMAPEETFTNFSLTAFAGIHQSMMKLSMPSQTSYSNLETSMDLRNEMESPSLDFSGGLLINYQLGKSWMLSSGIAITSFTQKVDFSVMPSVQSNPSLVQPANNYINPKDSIVVGSANSYENKYSFTEIPLYVSYHFPSESRVSFELMGGLSFGKLNLVNAYMPDPGCIGVLVVNDKASFPEFTNVFFASLAPSVAFKMNSSVDLGIMPSIKASLNSMVKNEEWIQQKPWLVGLGVYLRRRF